MAKYFYFLIKVNLLIENLDFFSRVFWLDWVYSGHLLEWSEEKRREQRCIFTFIFSLSSSDHCDANQNFLHSTSTLQNLQGKTPVNLLTRGGGGGGRWKLLYEESWWLLIENRTATITQSHRINWLELNLSSISHMGGYSPKKSGGFPKTLKNPEVYNSPEIGRIPQKYPQIFYF